MASNFLEEMGRLDRGSAIISAAALIAREGVDLHKGMNFRDSGPLLSVFLVLERSPWAGEGGFRDEWHPEKEMYVYEGHDSTTTEGGKLRGQVGMYESGRLSDNGKFYKAAQECAGGTRNEPLQVQVYEKLDAGLWFDKGIFNLVDAEHVEERGRKVFKFLLQPLYGTLSREDYAERMLGAAVKAESWRRHQGRCAVCGSEADLHFVESDGVAKLVCATHSGRARPGLL